MDDRRRSPSSLDYFAVFNSFVTPRRTFSRWPRRPLRKITVFRVASKLICALGVVPWKRGVHYAVILNVKSAELRVFLVNGQLAGLFAMLLPEFQLFFRHYQVALYSRFLRNRNNNLAVKFKRRDF